MSTRERRLIVSADDLGLHTGINEGILRCHRDGIVTSASLSPNGSAFEDAVRALQEAPGLDVGVHLTLVGEAPVSSPDAVPTLAPDGRFPEYFTTLFHRLLMGRVRIPEIESELTAQVSRARDAGLRISHLDSHQHVHLHPALLPVVLRVAERFGIRALRAATRILSLRGVRPALLSLFARRGAHRMRRAGLKTPDLFLGIAETGRLEEDRLVQLIEGLPAGTTELICHPGEGDAHIASRYRWGFQWDREAMALTSPRVRETVLRRGVRLLGYRDL